MEPNAQSLFLVQFQFLSFSNFFWQIVKAELKREVDATKPSTDPIDLVNSDDDNDEEEFEEWKAREIKRIKKYRDEKESLVLIIFFYDQIFSDFINIFIRAYSFCISMVYSCNCVLLSVVSIYMFIIYLCLIFFVLLSTDFLYFGSFVFI